MVDIGLLKDSIKDSGMTICSISEKSGIKRETLYKRFDKAEFTTSEVQSLSNVLGLDIERRDAIFFAK